MPSHVTIAAAETAERIEALAGVLRAAGFPVEVVLPKDPQLAFCYLLIGNDPDRHGDPLEVLRSQNPEILRDVYIITTRLAGIGEELDADEKVHLPFDLVRAAAALAHK